MPPSVKRFPGSPAVSARRQLRSDALNRVLDRCRRASRLNRFNSPSDRRCRPRNPSVRRCRLSSPSDRRCRPRNPSVRRYRLSSPSSRRCRLVVAALIFNYIAKL